MITPDRAAQVVDEMLAAWAQARYDVAAQQRDAHPDVVDPHGRVWTWSGRGDLYRHDDTLAYPLDMIEGLGLPPASLSRNHNYAGLCATCRQNWTTNESAWVDALHEAYVAWDKAVRRNDVAEIQAALWRNYIDAADV